uniref:Uncharacterized protein n=1 Tax=Anopheles culicifacies TaxID=139723 RepID=A0A182M4D8_9DIPT
MSSGSSLISLKLSTSIASCAWDASPASTPVSSAVGEAGVVLTTVGALPTTPAIPSVASCGEDGSFGAVGSTPDGATPVLCAVVGPASSGAGLAGSASTAHRGPAFGTCQSFGPPAPPDGPTPPPLLGACQDRRDGGPPPTPPPCPPCPPPCGGGGPGGPLPPRSPCSCSHWRSLYFHSVCTILRSDFSEPCQDSPGPSFQDGRSSHARDPRGSAPPPLGYAPSMSTIVPCWSPRSLQSPRRSPGPISPTRCS